MKTFISVGFILIALLMQGCGEPSVNHIAKKIVKVETPNGKYTTVNKSSGAYGRYQIMPATARHYTKKLNMNHSQWKKPKNQDKIFLALLSDNISVLKKKGISVNAFTVYGCHQQGATGFQCIMENKNMNAYSYKKLRQNIPSKYRTARNKDLRKIWINYWSDKMS